VDEGQAECGRGERGASRGERRDGPAPGQRAIGEREGDLGARPGQHPHRRAARERGAVVGGEEERNRAGGHRQPHEPAADVMAEAPPGQAGAPDQKRRDDRLHRDVLRCHGYRLA
jgi:hypothetical protein